MSNFIFFVLICISKTDVIRIWYISHSLTCFTAWICRYTVSSFLWQKILLRFCRQRKWYFCSLLLILLKKISNSNFWYILTTANSMYLLFLLKTKSTSRTCSEGCIKSFSCDSRLLLAPESVVTTTGRSRILSWIQSSSTILDIYERIWIVRTSTASVSPDRLSLTVSRGHGSEWHLFCFLKLSSVLLIKLWQQHWEYLSLLRRLIALHDLYQSQNRLFNEERQIWPRRNWNRWCHSSSATARMNVRAELY